MSDVLQIAKTYRGRLKAELAKVEDFLRMAEELSKAGGVEGALPFSAADGPAEMAPKQEPAKVETSAKAETPMKVETPAKAEAKPNGGEEAKTPFDRFRTAGG